MKNRGLKTRTPLSSTLQNELAEKLQRLSQETRIPLSKLLDEAVEDLIKKHGKN
jgi:predicted DNA-binding protein